MSNTTTQQGQRLGEVIEASSTSFVAQCYQLYVAPPLGCFVTAGSPPVYGVVCRVSVEPLDTSRPIIARGEGAASEEEIYRSNPQIARLLTSRFEALLVGHGDGERHFQFLPPWPPHVHAFVYAGTAEQIVSFTRQLDFLHLLVSSAQPAADEIVAACLREAAAAQPDGAAEFLARAGRALAIELAGDLPRLNAILRRLAP